MSNHTGTLRAGSGLYPNKVEDGLITAIDNKHNAGSLIRTMPSFLRMYEERVKEHRTLKNKREAAELKLKLAKAKTKALNAQLLENTK